MSSSPALLIDALHDAAVADYLKSLSDIPTVREATVAPGVVVTATIDPATGSRGWRLNSRRSHRAAIYWAASEVTRRAAEAEQVDKIQARTQERHVARQEHGDVQRVLAMPGGCAQLHHALAPVGCKTVDPDRLDALVRGELWRRPRPISRPRPRACRCSA
jgi:hypothetical protein